MDLEALKRDLYRLIKADMPSVAAPTPASGTALPISEQHFRSLAREVKTMKLTLSEILGGQPSPPPPEPPPPPAGF